MKNIKGLGMLGFMMAMTSTTNTTGSGLTIGEIIDNGKKPSKRVIPKGCQEYWFSDTGRLYIEYPGDHYNIVFNCIAASDRSAERKYSAWKSKR